MLVIIQVVVFVIQVQAFIAGAGHAWGFGTFGAIIAAVLICLVPMFGGMILAVMTYYGAYVVWDWTWWQALLLASPGFALTIFMLAGGAIISFFERPSGRRI